MGIPGNSQPLFCFPFPETGKATVYQGYDTRDRKYQRNEQGKSGATFAQDNNLLVLRFVALISAIKIAVSGGLRY